MNMYFLPPFLCSCGAVGRCLMRITVASQRGARQGFQDDFSGTGKISPKRCLTLAVAPGCRTSRHKRRRVLQCGMIQPQLYKWKGNNKNYKRVRPARRTQTRLKPCLHNWLGYFNLSQFHRDRHLFRLRNLPVR